MVKTCDRGLKMLHAGRGQHFQARGHSFPKPENNLFFFPTANWLTSSFTHFVIELAYTATVKSLTSERASNSDNRQSKMY